MRNVIAIEVATQSNDGMIQIVTLDGFVMPAKSARLAGDKINDMIMGLLTINQVSITYHFED